jgi:hypothetical protein
MAIAAMFEFNEKDGLAKYDKALEVGAALRDQPHRSVHVCYELPSGGFGVLDVWDSEEEFAKFGEVLGPVMQEVGLAADPKIYPVHNTM